MSDKKRMAITFDGAPNPPGTLNVLAALAKHGIKGTFFMEGHRLEKEAATAIEVKNQGHEIGNHSYSHPMFDEIDLQTAREEIEKTDLLLREKVGVETKLFRPPAGQLNYEVISEILALGYEVVIWSSDIPVYDWAGPTPEKVAERIISNARNDESIIVFHDRVELVPQVLDIIIPELRNKGFEFVTISELDKKGVIR
ncbi:MAG: polysaccharide deacetylase family protein [Zhaonellaceae bacterium]|jgi:peptidoglycan/xylan/chitin deacetylase (PgdA/CDA1 family)|nr:polysaccharide deacetylase family protein [Clostridia bacterium]